MSEHFPGVLGEIAQRFGPELAQALGEHYAGCRLEIPSRRKQAMASRDAAIRQEFNGKNMDELARRYGLSPSQIYRIARPKKKRRG